MSDYSLTLVLQFKTSKIINDMAKIQQKSEKISAFGGIFFVSEKIDRILSSVIDSHLGLRSKLIGYQSARLYGPAQHRAGRMMTINALSTSIRPSTSPLSAASRRNMLPRPPTTPSLTEGIECGFAIFLILYEMGLED